MPICLNPTGPPWQIPRPGVYAMGQAFFSLSVAGSGTVVYGSYLKSDVDVVSSAKYVAIFDTLAALLAGLVIIPAVFAYGMEPNSGPGLLFITIPSVIRSLPFGQLFAVLFFIAVLFAGMTSLINLLESPAEGTAVPVWLVQKSGPGPGGGCGCRSGDCLWRGIS